MAKQQAILALHRRGWSQRRIAREVGVSRDTVARYIGLERSNQARAPTGSQESDSGPPGEEKTNSADDSDAVCQTSFPGCIPASASTCEPYRERIIQQMAQGLSAKRIHQDLDADSGISYYSVRRFVQQLRGSREPPFRRMECEPGEEAQIDFGTGAYIVTENGRRKKTHILHAVLDLAFVPRCIRTRRQDGGAVVFAERLHLGIDDHRAAER